MIGDSIDLPLSRYLVAEGVFADNPLVLIDIGCRGGINPCWRIFEKDISAYGVDPMIDEIEALNSREKSSTVKYFAGYIGASADSDLMKRINKNGPFGNNTWDRLSTPLAMKLLANEDDSRQTKVNQNRWNETRLADPEKILSVDEFIKRHKISNVDFVKIDIDSYDLLVLMQCKDLVDKYGVLGFQLEVNFFGTARGTDHTFHNTDRAMREMGYELFDLVIGRYSRSALPAPFTGFTAARTVWGAPYQGDAYYGLDFVGKEQRSELGSIDVVKIMKMIAIHEIYGAVDCAAELLRHYRRYLRKYIDVNKALDSLVPQIGESKISYQEYMSAFNNDPSSFLQKRT